MALIQLVKIQYFKSPIDGQWYFHILAKNGRVVAQSEGYKRVRNCLKTVNLLVLGKIVSVSPRFQKAK